MDEKEMMQEAENTVEQAEKKQTEEMKDFFTAVSNEHSEIKESIRYLQDLFVRRLNEDKQKMEMIRHLQELSSFVLIEPFGQVFLRYMMK